ncbi:ABC transporter [Streptomyces sp. VRA16 Mangrove soil]|uniref:ABC transporter n=1 Tax=Streptomyces sp. VRA16 Mangrove soil TaxID=2817434 RepID=UPI001A9CC0E6|nr:ABC transporter [Streptomyces sp. VRA16 Mangrove soil]MBO1335552.1 ABC transporter [Streptomyces sp. VRA16 Mangrove soil]
MSGALLAYQSGLLLRSQRWLAPVVLYAAFVGVGVQSGQPVLDSLGYAAAFLLPVGSWLVRICVSNEPPAARSCTAAATGPWRAHLASLVTGFLATAVIGTVTTGVVALISDAASTDHRVKLAVLPAVGAGFLAMLVCALVGAAVGAVTVRPVVRATGPGVAAMLLCALLALVAPGSPARAAVTALITGSQDGVIRLPLLPLVGAVALAAVCGAAACRLSGRR